ncbi:MAG: monofunctional biosynthetic peptidoglycan transglycosylase [Hyphomicrobiales bacterium]|nr:monofunctional biosynthetic peptidoglycan transglycosylase [Hyphomicrobiales bacterium]
MAVRGRGSILRSLLSWALGLIAAGVLLLAALLALYAFVPPISTLMIGRWVTLRPVERVWTPLARISPALSAAVIMSEDARFCRHDGVDWSALNDVIDQAGEDGPSRGASTISMQTVKNLFLWPSRSFIRKGMEIPLALALDFVWTKKRVMEVYLNIAEWGEGVFGAEAAARRYFHKSAADLTAHEAALLATALPNPILRNPARPNRHHAVLARIIAGRAVRSAPWTDCVR